MLGVRRCERSCEGLGFARCVGQSSARPADTLSPASHCCHLSPAPHPPHYSPSRASNRLKVHVRPDQVLDLLNVTNAAVISYCNLTGP